MTSVNDTLLDLGLDVSQWKKYSNAGVGANANYSKADMMNFVGSDTLAELVWSPKTGLNIKVAQNKPCFIPEEGPSETRRLDTPNEQHIASSETHEAERHGSMESCRSANLSTKRKRGCSFKEQSILGCKRIKKEPETNMLIGLKSKETRFQNVFQSLNSPNTITLFENKSRGSPVIAKRCSQESLDYNIKNEKADLLVKQVSLYGGVSKNALKGMFDTIRRLRLSRTDIHKWMNSKMSVAELDGFFLRLRVAKWEQGDEGSRYYVACITGSQWEATLKDLRQPIRVKVGGVECFVESQHISNCDFIEEELIAWWQKTPENQRIPVVKDLKSKLAVRRTLGV